MEKVIFPGGSSRDSTKLGPKCVIISNDEWNLMIDCGAEFLPLKFLKDSDKYDKFLENSQNQFIAPINFEVFKGIKIDAALASHAHNDHIASFPLLENRIFKNNESKIYMSPHTCDLAPIVFYNTLKLNPDFYENVYNGIGVIDSLNRRSALPLGESVLRDKIRIFTGYAGHIPGAAHFTVETPSGKKCLDTGDMSFADQGCLLGSEFPYDIPDEWLPEYLIGLDLTNAEQYKDADKNSNIEMDYKNKIEELIRLVQESLKKEKTVIIAALQINKAQNVIVELVNNGFIPYIDGSIDKVSKVFIKNRFWSERLKDVSEQLTKVKKISSPDKRNELIFDKTPKVIVTTSGMGNGGPVETYLRHGLFQDNFLFIPTSYLPQESRFARLLKIIKNNNSKIRVKNEKNETELMEIKANIKQARISSHCRLENISRAIKILVSRKGKLLEKIFLTCGNYNGKLIAAKVLAPYTKNIVFANSGAVEEL